MKRYRLVASGALLITKAAVAGPEGTKILSLLVDTGFFTIIPVEALESCGCSPAEDRKHPTPYLLVGQSTGFSVWIF